MHLFLSLLATKYKLLVKAITLLCEKMYETVDMFNR
jgi:hypothetical protein